MKQSFLLLIAMLRTQLTKAARCELIVVCVIKRLSCSRYDKNHMRSSNTYELSQP